MSTIDNYGRSPLQLAQSKLKLIALNSGSENAGKIKTQVRGIITMMMEYLNKKGQNS